MDVVFCKSSGDLHWQAITGDIEENNGRLLVIWQKESMMIYVFLIVIVFAIVCVQTYIAASWQLR